MRSISIALTWEFWRQAGGALFTTIAILCGLLALLYRNMGPRVMHFFGDAHVHAFCFIGVIIGLAAVVCHSTASAQYRFTLPISIRASVFIPMINGVIATVSGYLAVALLLNSFYDAHWTLIKPTMLAICIVSLSQAVAWMFWSAPHLRGSIAAGVSAMLAIGSIVHLLDESHDFDQTWRTIRPLDICLTSIVLIFAYAFTFVVLTFARRGQVISIAAIGRWLLARLNITLTSNTHKMTPMAAELWSEWKRRGIVMPIGSFLFAIVLCGFFLSGRFELQSALNAIVAFTWLQVFGGAIVGLFLGHVGPRFDFHEHLATRPLSDQQLADVKLWNTLKSVFWTWITWALGVALAVLCLAVVGQGPTSWSDVVRQGIPPIVAIGAASGIVFVILLVSWTLTSLGVSVVILRPWLVKTLFCSIALLPFVPLALAYLTPGVANEIGIAAQWIWIIATIGGTVAIYATAFRLRLISARRIVLVVVAYLLLCASWLLFASFLPRPEIPIFLAIGFVLSTCILPFVCIVAAPLAVWWNRHR